MRIGRTMSVKDRGECLRSITGIRKDEISTVDVDPGKAFMEFTDSNVAVRIPIRTHCGLIWLIWFLGRNGFYSGVFR